MINDPSIFTFTTMTTYVSPRQKVAVYIASPYAIGDHLENTLKQFATADILIGLGYLPYPPLWTHYWDEVSPRSHEEWLEFDKEWILRCDCLLRLSGKSAGADEEVEFAKENDIPVFWTITELETYYGNQKD
jgi:hypothetical protein